MSPIVTIPGMPGESIDSRILPDVLAIIKKYKVKVTDGFATAGHAAGGEHPLGLAIDVVPDTARGGTWDDVDRLMKWAEPRQNAPRTPFRWVGYDGDPNHGRGHHGHLSWANTGRGRTVTTARGDIPDNDKGGISLGGALTAGGLDIITGVPGSAAKAVAGAAGDAAAGAAKALLNVIWDAFGEDGARILLYIALAAGGTTLAVLGLTRTFGVGAPNPGKLAATVVPAGRVAKSVKAAT